MLNLLNKNVREFSSILKTVKKLIRANRFSEAVEHYNMLNKAFCHIPKKNRTASMDESLRLVYKELRLYMRVGEAYYFAENGDMQRLGKELHDLHDIIYDLKEEDSYEVPPLIEATEKYYDLFSKFYKFNVTKSNFMKHYKKILEYISKDKIAEASADISRLVFHYHKLIPMLSKEDNIEIYSMLKGVYKELSIKKLLKKAHMKSFPVYGDVPRIETPAYESDIAIPDIRLKTTLQGFPSIYNKIRELIKKNSYYESFEKYEDRLLENFIPEGMLQTGFSRPTIDLPYHEKYITIPDIKLTSVVMYSKRYNKIHKLLIKGDYAKAVEMYERSVMHNYIPKDFLRDYEALPKVDIQSHKVMMRKFRVPETVLYSKEFSQLHKSVGENDYENSISIMTNNKVHKTKFYSPKIEIPEHGIILPEVETVQTAYFPEKYSDLHKIINKDEYEKATGLISGRKIKKEKFSRPRVYDSNHEVNRAFFKPLETATFPEYFSIMRRNIETGAVADISRIKKEIHIKNLGVKQSGNYASKSFKRKNTVRYSGSYGEIRGLLERGNYKKALKLYERL